MKLGLRSKIVLVALVVALIGVSAIVVINNWYFQAAYVSALQSRSSAIAQSLRLQMDRILQLGIQLDNLVGFDKQCQKVAESYAGIEFAMVADRDGQILFSSDPSNSGRRVSDSNLLAAVQQPQEASVEYTIGGINGYAAVVPILTADNAHLGSVVVGLNRTVVDDQLSEARSGAYRMAGATVVLGLLVLLAGLSRFVTKPLLQLIAEIERLRLEPDNSTVRVPVRTSDEIGSLATAFNSLMQRLQETTVSKSSLETAYGALQASEEKYRDLVSNANAIILRVNFEGTVVYLNEFAESFFGYSSCDIVGKMLAGTLLPVTESESGRDLAGFVGQILAAPEDCVEVETEAIHRDGRRFFIRWASRLILNDDKRPVGVLFIGHDVTEKRATDRELERHRNHLEEMVRERTVALSVAKEAAEAANRAKSAFLANMSHELRTPMNAIIGMTDLARRRAVEPKLVDQLTKVDQASKHLLGIINDVLDISKIEADRLTLEQAVLQIGHVVETCRQLIEHDAVTKGLNLRVEIAPNIADIPLIGDGKRLVQILVNLAGNAIKFTPVGYVAVRVGLHSEDDDSMTIRFEVADSGIGIEPADRPRLFLAFEQADGSLTRKYGGTGLGLAITKRLVEMMGGRLSVESVVGQGSTFWFTLCLAKAANLPEQITPRENGLSPAELLRSHHVGARVLVVEDEPMNQEVAKESLELVGLRVDIAGDGATSIVMAKAGAYDLILMDLQMPLVNGIDAAIAIRSLPNYKRTPIIAMTANAFEEDRRRCLEAGMNDHIGKPFVVEDLLALVFRWLERQPSLE